MTLRTPIRHTDLEVKKYIDSISESFCAAKYYNATIWLGSGMTTSCHHPLPHKIDENAIKTNPKLLHNTTQKKTERSEMLKGNKPSGCEYCWKLEGISKTTISDRVYKTVIYDESDIDFALKNGPDFDYNLKTLEIAFDRTCNFACSYCNPAFSTTWVKDIKDNGPYQDLISDGRNHYTHTHDSSQLDKDSNPYIDAFFKWWDSDLHLSLDELRITGGEPLMNYNLWKLIDWFENNKGKASTRLAINTNLGAKDDLIDKLIDKGKHINHLHIYTSNESMHLQANYIRDGLDFDKWNSNINKLLSNANLEGFHMMCTVNALCLESIVPFLNYVLSLKARYGKSHPTYTLNILRFPSFQSALVLPDNLRLRFKNDLQEWLTRNANNSLLHQMEINQTQRLIDYLDVVKTPHEGAFPIDKLQNDFKNFYRQYDKRRNKSIIDSFPIIGEWYKTL